MKEDFFQKKLKKCLTGWVYIPIIGLAVVNLFMSGFLFLRFSRVLGSEKFQLQQRTWAEARKKWAGAVNTRRDEFIDVFRGENMCVRGFLPRTNMVAF